MNIIKTNVNAEDKKAVYRLTRSNAQRVQDIPKGTSFPIDAYMLYDEDKERKKKDGGVETITERILSFVSGDTKAATISDTFIKEFMFIVDLMDGEPFSIIITGGTSKGGREFVSCELDCDA